MKLNYYPETDSLYIDLSERSSADSREISEGVVLDYDADGKLVGIDMEKQGYCRRLTPYASHLTTKKNRMGRRGRDNSWVVGW